VVAVVLPSQYLFGWMIIKNKLANAKYVNARGTIFQELLPAMKLVKYYAWERFFEKEVSDVSGLPAVCFFGGAGVVCLWGCALGSTAVHQAA
jgi:hypothetical protein